jgi:hypothetical protein
MNVDLTQPQSEFFNSTAKSTCAVAGFGSGKTDVAMFRMISSAIAYPTGDWLYAAPTIPLIRDILWSKLSQFLPMIGLPYSINKSEGIVYLHGLGKIFCRSMDNPDRLVGFEVVDAFMDELDILPKDKALAVYRKIKARCRMKVPISLSMPELGYKLNQQWVTTTPEGFRATYELFKKNPAPNTHLVQMSTYSNAHNLPDDYIDDLKASYPTQLIDAYLLGKFVNLNALGVWPSYDPDLNHMSVELLKNETIHFGQDFNVGRGCMVPYVFRNLPVGHLANPTQSPLKIMVTVGEIVDSFDTPDSIRAANEMFPKLDYSRLVYPDATGNFRKSVNASISDLALMKHAGFRVRTLGKVNPSVKDRIIASNAAFCNAEGVRRVFVDLDKSHHYSEALVQQAYDKNGLPEKGMGKNDDLTDAGTYPINFHFPVRANKMFTSTVGGL